MHFTVRGMLSSGAIISLHKTALRYICLVMFCMIIDLFVPGVFVLVRSTYGEVFHAVFNSCYIAIESVFRSHSFTLLS